MLLQIGFRYALNAPLTWTEELARYLYVWACYLGAAVALRRRSHIAITLVADDCDRASRASRAWARRPWAWSSCSRS